jgi:hypothetical protein
MVDYKFVDLTLQGPKRYVDLKFLRPSVHGPKRAGRIVARTKCRGTKRQGTLLIHTLVCFLIRFRIRGDI